MKKAVVLLLLLISMTVLNVKVGFTQELKADEIIEKANLASYYAGNDGKADRQANPCKYICFSAFPIYCHRYEYLLLAYNYWYAKAG